MQAPELYRQCRNEMIFAPLMPENITLVTAH